MEGINKIFCGSDVKNTGTCECFFDPKLIVGSIKVPLNRVFTEAELADAAIQATLEAAVSAAKAARIFPFQPFEAITDNTEEPTRQTFGYGTVKTVREGKYNWAFQFLNGGVNANNALRSYNGLTAKYGEIFFTSDNILIGTSKKDANGEWGMAAVPMADRYTRPWRPSDGTNVANYTTEFSFEPVYINEKIAFKKVSIDSYLLAELAGLEDIKLSILGFSGVATAVVGAATDCGSTDVFDLYADELETPDAWIVTDSAGTVKTIAAVTKNDPLKGWSIGLQGAEEFEDGDIISLAAPTVLGAAPINVVGYESDTVIVDLGS